MRVRSQATYQRPADRTARTGDQNSHRASFQLALRRLEAKPRQCSAASTQRIEVPVRAKPSHNSINCRAVSRSLVGDLDLGAPARASPAATTRAAVPLLQVALENAWLALFLCSSAPLRRLCLPAAPAARGNPR